MGLKVAVEQKHVLIVEDNADIIDLIEIHLEELNCMVDKAFEGNTGLAKALNNTYHLIILDLTLPFKNGIEICEILREKDIQTPILMLTARSENVDKVKGLEIGANIYMTKPFSIHELKMNVKRLIQANGFKFYENSAAFTCEKIILGNLELDTSQRKVWLNSKSIQLEEKEYLLLALLACHPGKVFTRSEILTTIWGYNFYSLRYTVISYISRLRQKIEPDFQNPQYILNTPEGGYQFKYSIN